MLKRKIDQSMVLIGYFASLGLFILFLFVKEKIVVMGCMIFFMFLTLMHSVLSEKIFKKNRKVKKIGNKNLSSEDKN